MSTKEEVKPKVLRYGVIRKGNIVEEQHVPRGNSIFVDAASDPIRFFHRPATSMEEGLLEWTGLGYRLNFRRELVGRIHLGGEGASAKGLDAFVQEGEVEQREDGLCMLRLPETARGKVVIRGTTILFQFVVPPRPRPVKKVPFMQRLARAVGL